MAGLLNGFLKSACGSVPPCCGFSLSLLCNYHEPLLTSHPTNNTCSFPVNPWTMIQEALLPNQHAGHKFRAQQPENAPQLSQAVTKGQPQRSNQTAHTHLSTSSTRTPTYREHTAATGYGYGRKVLQTTPEVLHGESSQRLATPRNTKDKKHLQSTQSAHPTNLTDQAPSTTDSPGDA